MIDGRREGGMERVGVDARRESEGGVGRWRYQRSLTIASWFCEFETS